MHRGQRFFAPNHLFRPSCPIVTPEIIHRLREGATLLSIGAGPAYTEQLLVNRFGVPRSSIHLADISSESIPSEFTFHSFDMHLPWPKNLGKYNYVVFSESATLINCQFSDAHRRVAALGHLLLQGAEHLLSSGQVRIEVVLMLDQIQTALQSCCKQLSGWSYEINAAHGSDTLIVLDRPNQAREQRRTCEVNQDV